MKNNYALIMAGGVGSRFWPISTPEKPKQFIDILGIGKSLLQLTVERITSMVPSSNIFILTNEDYKGIVLEQLPILKSENVICEPQRKNTAPCIAFASAKIHSKNANAKLVILPSDHLIINESSFLKTIQNGLQECENNSIVTIGINPTRPETGYGYIEISEEDRVDQNLAFEVIQFREKPNLEIAKQFLESGNFLWNAGIFIWKSEIIIESFKKYSPDLFDLFFKNLAVYNSTEEAEFAVQVFSKCEDISIDYAILEKAPNVRVICADFDWSDLGTWNSLSQHLNKDNQGNHVNSEKISHFECNNNVFILPKDKTAIIDGLNGYLVIDQNNKLLILKIANDQKIKEYLKSTEK